MYITDIMTEPKKGRWKLCWSRDRKNSGGAFKRPRKRVYRWIEDKT
jgi:hypothetical protein